jgi:hypothetical protein
MLFHGLPARSPIEKQADNQSGNHSKARVASRDKKDGLVDGVGLVSTNAPDAGKGANHHYQAADKNSAYG